jgi:hypothetical protein
MTTVLARFFHDHFERRSSVGYAASGACTGLSWCGMKLASFHLAIILPHDPMTIVATVFQFVGYIGITAGATGAIFTALIQRRRWQREKAGQGSQAPFI